MIAVVDPAFLVRPIQPSPGLVFVSTGDAALTRRLKPMADGLVMGLLVTRSDLHSALVAIASTEESRRVARERARAQRAEKERAYREAFRAEMIRHFPQMPIECVDVTTAWATEVGSRRVGRSQRLDLVAAVRRAVGAHVRHHHTGYDQLLEHGVPRIHARKQIEPDVKEIVNAWKAPSASAE
ncbi:MAG: DUF2293 domain-containing protein [Anaerolineae bacterium]